MSESLSTQEVNVLAYIAGYIVRQLRKKVCPPCVSKRISKLSIENPDHDLLRQKKYQDAKDGLITPSVALTDAVSTMEIQYRKVIDDLMYSNNVKAHLIGNLSNYVVVDSLACDVCKCHLMIIHIMVNIWLHHALTASNRSLSSNSDKRKNRKILKCQNM